jgi:hypothetical protein
MSGFPITGTNRTRLGRRLHLELLGQPADLCRRIASVATKGLQKRELAFGGPAGHGLGRHLQDVGHLVVRRQRGSSGAALPPGWAATAHPFHAAGPLVMPDPNETQVFVRPPQQAAAATMLLRHPAECRRNTKIMQTDPTARGCLLASKARMMLIWSRGVERH